MIVGSVTSDREAIIRLRVRGPSGVEEEIEAVIDTGFDGCLSVSPALIASLGLAWRRRGRALLAGGTEAVFDIHEGLVIWDGQPRRIAIDSAEMVPLVGMTLLDGYELNIQVRPTGRVEIRVLP